MALTQNLSAAAAALAAAAVTGGLDGGYLRLYDGAQPATADVAVTTQTLLAELRFATPAFTPIGDGTATVNALTPDDYTLAGTPTWFRALASDGVTVLLDGSVGTTGCNLNFNTVTFVLDGRVTVDTWTYTQRRTA